MSGSNEGKNIERMLNSSLDDIVRDSRREGWAGRSGPTNGRGRGPRAGRGPEPRRTPEYNRRAPEPRRRGEKKPSGVSSVAKGQFKSSPSQPSRGKGRNGEKVRKVGREEVRSIQIVAKLDSIPTPTAQQKAGIRSLEVIPSSISSQNAKRSRVFG
ncbi:hypothetical protein OJ252_792 [Cryptosporidium canis]|uniref:Uncharacterized protein n=1 Tax=Cryptosporidium canis TaxID=195482 RepID=A0ABQ8PA24_9CRYT|nr:hypothetical protein OJ252_792 [Cryptosporidium canis]